ncbi:unnamed protein product [Urochloa humidicola]
MLQRKYKAATRRRLPPGPAPLPVIGNLLDVASRLPHRSLARLAERYGPLMTLRLGSAVVIVASSPAAAREVLRTHNGSITGRNAPDAWNGAGHAANSVFVLPPRRRWRALRRIGAEHLLSPRRLDGLRLATRSAVLEMRRRVSESAAAAAPVGVGRVAFEAMADLLWRALFSSGLDAATLSELHRVATEAVLLALKPNISDFFPALAALDLQGVRRGMARQMGRVYELIDQEIDRRMLGRETDSVSDQHKADLLEVMLDMSEQGKVDGLVMNRDVMRAFLTDIFLAAIETVPGAIEWAMAVLLQNRETMKKLKELLQNPRHASNTPISTTSPTSKQSSKKLSGCTQLCH